MSFRPIETNVSCRLCFFCFWLKKKEKEENIHLRQTQPPFVGVCIVFPLLIFSPSFLSLINLFPPYLSSFFPLIYLFSFFNTARAVQHNSNTNAMLSVLSPHNTPTIPTHRHTSTADVTTVNSSVASLARAHNKKAMNHVRQLVIDAQQSRNTSSYVCVCM